MPYQISTQSSKLEFDTALGAYNMTLKVDANHFINWWAGPGTDGFFQAFAVNTSTYAISTSAARLEFDTANNVWVDAIAVDTNHFVVFWAGSGVDGFAQVMQVNTTTWAVTTSAARIEYDTVNGDFPSAAKIDTNHFVVFYAGSGSDGFVQVFTVNTTTWAVTTSSARLEFDTVNGVYHAAAVVDANHFINFWSGNGSDGFAQVFEVNTTTWAVTTSAASLEFDTQNNFFNRCRKIDTNHFVNVWHGGADSGVYAQAFEVNTTTWVVTTCGALFNITTDSGAANGHWIGMETYDSNKFLVSWMAENFYAWMQMIQVNTSTWAITTVSNAFNYDTTTVTQLNPSMVLMDQGHVVTWWASEAVNGYTQVMAINEIIQKDGSENTETFGIKWGPKIT